MLIGDRLRELRKRKNLSQAEIAKRSGLVGSYISRIENSHTVPAIETLEKFARALEVPMYQLFYDGEEPSKLRTILKRKVAGEIAWGSSGKEARFLHKFRRLMGRIKERDRRLLMLMAQNMAKLKAIENGRAGLRKMRPRA